MCTPVSVGLCVVCLDDCICRVRACGHVCAVCARECVSVCARVPRAGAAAWAQPVAERLVAD